MHKAYLALGVLILSLGCESPVVSQKSRSSEMPATTEKSTPKLPSVCQKYFSKKNICASLKWNTALAANDDAEATLRFYSLQGETLTSLGSEDIGVEPFMASHGHGSPGEVEVFDNDAGEFILENIIFSMPGEWQIRVQILNEQKKVIDEAVWIVVV